VFAINFRFSSSAFTEIGLDRVRFYCAEHVPILDKILKSRFLKMDIFIVFFFITTSELEKEILLLLINL